MKSPKNLVILVLALTTIGGATVAWRQYQELIDLRAGALTKGERANLQTKLWAAEKRAKELADQLAARRNPAGGEDGAVAVDGEVPGPDGTIRRGRRGPGGGPGGPGGLNNMMAIMERPEVQKLMAIEQKGQLDSRFAALFKSLHLSPEQLDKFKTLLVERQTAMQDVIAAARAQGIDFREDPAGLRKMIADTQAEVDNSIKATLGDEGFAKYQNYQETIPQRNVVNQLQQSLSYTGSPLTDAQAEQLVQILAQTAPKNSPGGARMMGATVANEMNVTVGVGSPEGARGGPVFSVGTPMMGFGGGGTTITDQAIAQAQSVLSAEQVQGLQQLQQQQQAQQQLQQTIRQSFGGGGGGGRNNGGGGSGTTSSPPAATK